MLILGESNDDKGAQLEQLVRTLLQEQGYTDIRRNFVGAGGNELDIVAVREAVIVGATQRTPIVCEAKAKSDAVDMPMWQRFLGKLFMERVKDSTTVGILVALNGINGNVAGSYTSLKQNDSSIFVFEGLSLIDHALSTKQLSEEADVEIELIAQFHKTPRRLEVAYYRGAFMWIVYWSIDTYSIVDGRGQMLLTEDIEDLREALRATVGGTLVATDEAMAEAETRHLERLEVINKLLRGDDVLVDADLHLTEAITAISEEPFAQLEGNRLQLATASELNSQGIARLFTSLFEGTVRIPLLSFMIDGHHIPYVNRLVELIPELQSGFSLDEEDEKSLQAIAPLFPSVWLRIASPISAIAAHSDQLEEGDEQMRDVDRAVFWEVLSDAIRSDYGNAGLGGFLYDHLHVAELEMRTDLVVKSKSGPVGLPIRTKTRDAIRQYTDETVDANRPVYVMVRILPGIPEPWDDSHPEPEFPLV